MLISIVKYMSAACILEYVRETHAWGLSFPHALLLLDVIILDTVTVAIICYVTDRCLCDYVD